MSDMEAMKVILKPLGIEESKTHFTKLCEFEEWSYERDCYLRANNLREIDDTLYETQEIDLDPYGFADATYNPDGSITVVGLWYNGGGCLDEILEEALKA